MKKNLFAVLCLCTFVNTYFGQPGKDGSLTISSQNIIVNRYSPVVADVSAGSSTVEVTSCVDLNLCLGDLIMVYQAQGASMSTANTGSYGSITNYNSAGLYEFFYVQSITGNIIGTQTSFMNSYSSTGKTQVVKVPQYSLLVINGGANIACKAWKDTVIGSAQYRFGGLVVIHSNDIINNGTISAKGAGFRGGQVVQTTTGYNGQSAYLSNSFTTGGEKGESICGYQQDYDILGGRYSRGAPANGGGGGCSNNSGGGGGANGSNSNIWTGTGVMIVDPSNPLAAWMLDPDYIANGNSLTNSSGGGRGGYSWGANNLNATVTGPGSSSWGGDSRRNVGGLGGRPLSNINAETRVYFGGGGGAGHTNDNAGSAASNGGGIIYLIAPGGISGTGQVIADGNDAGNTVGCSCDAASGAGAGGSIVVKTSSISTSQVLSARGGKGGSQVNVQPVWSAHENDGPGGGGGGGFIALSNGTVNIFLSGGASGITSSSGVTEFPANGATYGADGQTGTVSTTFISYTPSVGQYSITSNSPLCAGASLNLSTNAQGSSFSWQGPNGFSSQSQNPTLINVSSFGSGIYSLNLLSCNSVQTITTNVVVNPLPSISVNGNFSVCQGEHAMLTANGGDNYFWSTNSAAQTITVSPTSTTNYTVNVTNTLTSCTNSASLTVNVFPLPIISVSGNFTICAGGSTTLTASGADTYGWSNNAFTSTVNLSPLQTNTYNVSGTNTVTGCSNNTTVAVYVNDCNLVGLESNNLINFSVSIFPNPTEGLLHLKTDSLVNDIRIELYNNLGQLILEQKDLHYLDIGTSAPGVYLIRVLQSKRLILQEKIVKR